jgi:transcriptional regulator with XRE-family HTH domain/quercetin dioxygenase-like cupin family protein
MADPEPRAGADPALEIGARVTACRVQRGMKVSELARRIGVSPSMVSQIERGQSRPSVSTLFGLAEALDVPVDAFFRDSEPPPRAVGPVSSDRRGPLGNLEAFRDASRPAGGDRHVVRRAERAAIDIEGGVRWERLTPATLAELDFLELVYAPGAESHPALYRHPGTEMVLVLSGTLDIVVGFERHRLEPGDSICFPSSTPHRYANPGDETARAVTVLLHDTPPRDGA